MAKSTGKNVYGPPVSNSDSGSGGREGFGGGSGMDWNQRASLPVGNIGGGMYGPSRDIGGGARIGIGAGSGAIGGRGPIGGASLRVKFKAGGKAKKSLAVKPARGTKASARKKGK